MARSAELLLPLGQALFRQSRWPDRAALARAVGTSPGALAPWAQFLTFHRALRETASGVEADFDRLLGVLTAHRMANLRPEVPLDTVLDVRGVHAALQDRSVPHAFAMFSAANEWAFFEPRRDVHVYVPRSALPELRRSLGPGPRRGGGAGVLQAYVEDPVRLDVQSRTGLPVTGPFQTVVDLRAHPEGGAHAAFLQANLLPRLREARG